MQHVKCWEISLWFWHTPHQGWCVFCYVLLSRWRNELAWIFNCFNVELWYKLEGKHHPRWIKMWCKSWSPSGEKPNSPNARRRFQCWFYLLAALNQLLVPTDASAATSRHQGTRKDTTVWNPGTPHFWKSGEMLPSAVMQSGCWKYIWLKLNPSSSSDAEMSSGYEQSKTSKDKLCPQRPDDAFHTDPSPNNGCYLAHP